MALIKPQQNFLSIAPTAWVELQLNFCGRLGQLDEKLQQCVVTKVLYDNYRYALQDLFKKKKGAHIPINLVDLYCYLARR